MGTAYSRHLPPWLKAQSPLELCTDRGNSRLDTHNLCQPEAGHFYQHLSCGVLAVASSTSYKTHSCGDEVEVSCFLGLDIINHNSLDVYVH